MYGLPGGITGGSSGASGALGEGGSMKGVPGGTISGSGGSLAVRGMVIHMLTSQLIRQCGKAA